ncbi:MAG: phosphomannomutase/phosphoglucomutase [Xanthomonadaceae bacterium]|jgi:phosphomannomutase/phosphoglucomutase|nr:phosphomannomutase/phosphoglucomutase [Xanthomonadaceae bacterium]
MGKHGKVQAGQRKWLTPLLGVILLLLGGWFGWNGIQQWQVDSQFGDMVQVSQQAAGAVEGRLNQLTRQLQDKLASAPVQAALAANDGPTAAAAMMADWQGALQAQVWSSDLGPLYADIEQFGYARLALLETALAGDEARAGVVREDGQPRLGLAAPARTGSGKEVVVYVSLPVTSLSQALDSIPVPARALLSLKQGSYTVVAKGMRGADRQNIPVSVGATGMHVVSALPYVPAGPFELQAKGGLMVGGLLLLLAVLTLMLPRIQKSGVARPGKAKDSVGRAAELTLQQTVGKTIPPAAEPAAPAAKQLAPALPVMETPGAVATELSEDIFRAYDIRGIAGKELTSATAVMIGQAVGSLMQEQGLTEIVVGRDGRLSGPELVDGLSEGLRTAGCNVIDIGMAPTPLVYFGTYFLRTGCGIAVTGSHNPSDYNGFKIVVAGEALSGDSIKDLYRRIAAGRLHRAAETGRIEQRAIDVPYIQRIAEDVQMERPLKVVIDAGNGVGGEIAPRLLEAIGAEVIPLHCEIDGDFPNHHPDPSEPKNLRDLVTTVQQFDADIGLALDGDADRLGVVTRQGEIIYPDRLLMLFAADLLQRNPGATVIYDVKCTGMLSDYILQHGGSPLMWKTGHSLIKAKMRETGAALAGEMSGHFFFGERWYGFDDGLYAAARLLEILAADARTPAEVLERLPNGVSTPEIKIDAGAADPHALVARFVELVQAEGSGFSGAHLTMIDGLRADWLHGWGLVRASNTTPVLVLRFEAASQEMLNSVKRVFQGALQKVLPDTSLG